MGEATTDMADLPPLPPRKTDQPSASLAASAGRVSPKQKPDPRPMRIVYGAGAVAVVSVIAVGLVQPDFTATADQPATNDANVADVANNQDNGRTDQSGNGANQPNVQVKHVVKYIHLKPGQSAPPGAKVITPGQPTPRVVVANNPAPNPTPATNHNPNPGNNNPPPPKATPQPTPRPTPRPTIKTRQSGHP
jgi:hypothetical protein